MLLDKIMYKQHPLFSKLKDSPISEYNPKWVKNVPNKEPIIKETVIEKTENKEKLGWDNF